MTIKQTCEIFGYSPIEAAHASCDEETLVDDCDCCGDDGYRLWRFSDSVGSKKIGGYVVADSLGKAIEKLRNNGYDNLVSISLFCGDPVIL